VGSLQTENAALHSRTSILEKVLNMRNEQIQVTAAVMGAGLVMRGPCGGGEARLFVWQRL